MDDSCHNACHVHCSENDEPALPIVACSISASLASHAASAREPRVSQRILSRPRFLWKTSRYPMHQQAVTRGKNIAIAIIA